MTKYQKEFRRRLTGFGMLLAFFFFVVIGLGMVKVIAGPQQTGKTTDMEATSNSGIPVKPTDSGVIKFAFLAAAIAVGVGSLGAGAAVGYVGAAAMGAIGEKPELAGRALIFVGLAEGIAIYGLIIAIMILQKV